jgi:mono/diheme cytochrome c family protein
MRGTLVPVVAIVTAVGATLAAAGLTEVSPPLEQQASQLPDGAGKQQMVTACGRCHEAERSASLRLTRAGWETVIADMVQRGAIITDGDRTAILDYLSTYLLGEAAQPLNINTATNIDLESVAGLTRKESAALRQWLQTNGPCKALEDLKKAPINYKSIEERRDFLLCASRLTAAPPQ